MSLLLLSIFVGIISVVNSLSACDDIDIIFLLDQDSITNNLENVLTFIESIIHDGSSEYSAFSAYVYGDDVSELEINLLDTFDTFRSNKSDIIAAQLKQAFQQIATLQKKTDLSTRTVSLIEAFNMAAQQQQPLRTHKKRNKFNTEKYKKHNIGGADDENRYFIFDYYNKLLTSTTELDDVCQLYEYITGKSDESIHFIFGHDSNNFDYVGNGFCDGVYDGYIHEDSFFYLESDDITDYSDHENAEFDEGFLYNLFTGAQTIESVYHITCPAYHAHPSGFMHLTAHNQFIDRNTFIKCNLKYDNNENDRDPNAIGAKLRQDKSYILVHDHLHDDNTFKLNDFLIADPETFEQIKDIGCAEPIYKIVDIKHVKTVSDSHKMLKLYVQLPESLMDFILSIDVSGEKHPGQNIKKNIINSDPRHKSYNATDEFGDRRRLPLWGGKTKYDQLVDESSDEAEKEFLDDQDVDQKTKTLVDKTFPLKYFKEWTTDVDVPLVAGFRLVGSGKGSVNFGLELAVKSTVDYKLKWGKILTGKKVKSAIKFTINGDWSLTGNVKLVIDAKLSLEGTLIPEIGQVLVVPIGVVPLVLKPYFKTDMKIDLTSLYFEFTLTCNYAERITIAYDYEGTRKSEKSLFKEDNPPKGVIAKSAAAILRKVRSVKLFSKSKSSRVVPRALPRSQTVLIQSDSSETAPVEDLEEEPSGPWSFKREQTANTMTTKLILANQKDKTCDVKIGFDIIISPRIGIAIYGAVKLQAGFNVKIPVKYGVKIESGGICPNKKEQVCPPKGLSIGAVAAIRAVPEVSVSIQALAEIIIAIPNLLRGLKEFFVLRKIYKGMKDDIVTLGKMTEQSAKDLIKLYNEFKIKWERHNGLGFAKARDIFATLLPKIESWYAKYKLEKGKIEAIIANCKKRIAKIKKMIARVKKIIDKPFEMRNFKHDLVYPKAYKEIWKWTPSATHCTAIPKDSIAAQVFTDKNKNGCCKGFTYTAKEDIFGDWYDGFDGYYNEYDNGNGYENEYENEYEYDEYDNGYIGHTNQQFSHLRSSPIIHNRSANNPFVALMMLDIFALFVVMICICGCCGLALGVFAFYKYDKLSAQKEYEHLTQNDEQI